jgi:hypothetical protein
MVWKLDGDTAEWNRNGVQLKAPLGHIQRGLEWSMDGREEPKSRLFQIDLREVPPPRSTASSPTACSSIFVRCCPPACGWA